MSAGDSYIETEVKIRFPQGPEAARALLEQHGYRLKQERTLESDQVFDRETGDLRTSDQLLRLRRSGERAILTYKGPGRSARHKSREEIETAIADPDAFTRLLERLGYLPRFRYEKYRTKFALPGEPGEITIDETPIGVFLELEGPPNWIDQTASRIGLSASAYLTRSYAALYAEYRRSNPSAPADMTFDL